MKNFGTILISITIGLLLGLWLGVNIGKDRDLLTSPFAEDSIQKTIKKSGERILEKSGEAMEKGGKALKDKMKDSQSMSPTPTTPSE